MKQTPKEDYLQNILVESFQGEENKYFSYRINDVRLSNIQISTENYDEDTSRDDTESFENLIKPADF